MAKFLLLARGGMEARRGMSPEEMQQVIQRYMAWTVRMEKAGRLAGANKLRDDEGRVLRHDGGKLSVTDGPFAESKEIVGGYWLFEAKNYDEAIELTRDHPHLGAGTLEIRQLHDYTQK